MPRVSHISTIFNASLQATASEEPWKKKWCDADMSWTNADHPRPLGSKLLAILLHDTSCVVIFVFSLCCFTSCVLSHVFFCIHVFASENRMVTVEERFCPSKPLR